MTKKILLGIGILLTIGIFLFLIFSPKPETSNETGRLGFSFRDFLPFGNPDSQNNNNNSKTEETKENEEIRDLRQDDIAKLRKISKEPVAGAVIFNVGTTTFVRFIEKGTGNVYEARSDSSKIERLTNTTIPKIIRSYWLPNGSGFLAQTLLLENEIIETSFVKLNKNLATSSESLTPFDTKISKLPTNIREISIKPDSSKIFYYTQSSSFSNWFVANPDGTNNKIVNSDPLSEWLPNWFSENTIAMQTKSSAETLSYLYYFDLKNNKTKKMGLGEIGLFSLPKKDGSKILTSAGGSFPKLFVISEKDWLKKDLNTNTLADKCIWSNEKGDFVYCAVPTEIPNGSYPDAWYKGLINTEDSIIKIDIENELSYNISDLSSESKEKIDVIDLMSSGDNQYLIFRNKIDGFLWLLRISEEN